MKWALSLLLVVLLLGLLHPRLVDRLRLGRLLSLLAALLFRLL